MPPVVAVTMKSGEMPIKMIEMRPPPTFSAMGKVILTRLETRTATGAHREMPIRNAPWQVTPVAALTNAAVSLYATLTGSARRPPLPVAAKVKPVPAALPVAREVARPGFALPAQAVAPPTVRIAMPLRIAAR